MKSVPVKAHVSQWRAIHVTKADEPTRIYKLDRSGRLGASDVPRNPRRTLTDRTKLRTTFAAVEKSGNPLMDLEDSSPIDLLQVDWDMPMEATGLSLTDVAMFKEINEEFGIC
jgi:hypothetical protein